MDPIQCNHFGNIFLELSSYLQIIVPCYEEETQGGFHKRDVALMLVDNVDGQLRRSIDCNDIIYIHSFGILLQFLDS